MADGINRVTAMGNLVDQAELRVTQGGQAVLKFRLACNESYLDKSNERKERCEYITCTLWGKRGEALAQYMTKGSRVLVEGSLRTTSSEKDGLKRYFTEVNVNNVVLCGGGKSDGAERPQRQSYGGGGASRKPAPPADAGSSSFDDYGGASGGDDEIPFALNMTLTRTLRP